MYTVLQIIDISKCVTYVRVRVVRAVGSWMVEERVRFRSNESNARSCINFAAFREESRAPDAGGCVDADAMPSVDACETGWLLVGRALHSIWVEANSETLDTKRSAVESCRNGVAAPVESEHSDSEAAGAHSEAALAFTSDCDSISGAGTVAGRLRIDAVCGVRVERGFRYCSRSVGCWQLMGSRARERRDTGLEGIVNGSASTFGAGVVITEREDVLSLEIKRSGSITGPMGLFARVGEGLLCLLRGLNILRSRIE